MTNNAIISYRQTDRQTDRQTELYLCNFVTHKFNKQSHLKDGYFCHPSNGFYDFLPMRVISTSVVAPLTLETKPSPAKRRGEGGLRSNSDEVLTR